ncbi:kinase-like domain-containing protein [Aspergillus arachidicola]|uniref:Kinase-like domain-containing protein n=1 Tax=Aspergillus arachidicola TaxID=656916 RepID=A0A5N6XPT0_9EURO|nr:kinase-like domain-containing protein [Aspergillus arachidicola]
MKEEYVQVCNSPLIREFQVYQSLREQTGFRRIYCFSEVAGYRVMVMELLGPSLEDLVVSYGRSLGLQIVSWVACTLLERIEELHEQSWIYGGIKPQNFLLDIDG